MQSYVTWNAEFHHVVLAGIMWSSRKIFKRLQLSCSLIILKISAHFAWLFETSASPYLTASKQTMQNILMTTVELLWSFDNTKPQTSMETNFQLITINWKFKCLIGLKITLVKFTHPKGKTGHFPLCPIILLSLWPGPYLGWVQRPSVINRVRWTQQKQTTLVTYFNYAQRFLSF